MDVKAMKKFLESRPAISRAALAREAGITGRYLTMILDGERPLTKQTAAKLKPVMEKYGYSE